MNIKTRKEYSRFEQREGRATRLIAMNSLVNFGKIKSGSATQGYGQRIVRINSLNDYCRRPAFLQSARGKTLRCGAARNSPRCREY